MKFSLLLLPLMFPAAPAFALDPVPDFSLPEINTLSTRYRATTAPVSVRDYRHQVTAWYFGAET